MGCITLQNIIKGGIYMIQVLISGCNGKMGQEVAKQIWNLDAFNCIAGFDRMDLGDNKFPVYTDLSKVTEKPDIIIDFSIPEATFKILDFASKNNIPVVIATTGFTDEEMEKIKEYSKTIPIFKAANMSFEVNLMAKLASEIAKSVQDSDIEIVETHHNRKIDAPSGTALFLADSINNTLENKMEYEYNRHSKREKRKKNEIGIHSIRGGNIVGKHTVTFFSDDEYIEITHNVSSRSVFAKGAIKAADFLVHKAPGMYDMNNLL